MSGIGVLFTVRGVFGDAVTLFGVVSDGVALFDLVDIVLVEFFGGDCCSPFESMAFSCGINDFGE